MCGRHSEGHSENSFADIRFLRSERKRNTKQYLDSGHTVFSPSIFSTMAMRTATSGANSVNELSGLLPASQIQIDKFSLSLQNFVWRHHVSLITSVLLCDHK